MFCAAMDSGSASQTSSISNSFLKFTQLEYSVSKQNYKESIKFVAIVLTAQQYYGSLLPIQHPT
jgi:hypothetical protein